MIDNADLSELLLVASESEVDNKQKALRRAGRSAYVWREQAAALAAAPDRSLTELPSVGPYVAGRIEQWLADPPEIPERPRNRSGFMSMARAHEVLREHPDWAPLADLQLHTTETDGNATLEETVAALRNYDYIAITDHSQELKITNGMDEARLAAQGERIDAINARGDGPRVLKGIEMNVSPLGEGDMDPDALARLDLVLGAFHSKLRLKDDQTDRYVAALRNPTIDVLAHPRARMFGVRDGLDADWDRVFQAAADEGVVLEIDCTIARQDLNVDMARQAAEHDVWFSLGTDSHDLGELQFMAVGLATAILAGIPRERILNFSPPERWPRRARRGR